jgi:hypothetical protein
VLAVTGNLFSSSPFVIAAQVAAVGLNVWARRSFQEGTFRVSAAPAGTSIIRRGPYRVIRHPMYSAALLFIWAAVVSHVSVLTLTIGIAATVVAIGRVIAEERLLRAQFPEIPRRHPIHEGLGAILVLKRLERMCGLTAAAADERRSDSRAIREVRGRD